MRGRAAAAVSHGATIAYEFHDAMLVRGNMFAWRACLTVRGGRAPWLAIGTVAEHDAGALASTQLGVRYFGHWLLDDLPLQLAAREIASPVTVLANPTPSQVGYAAALGMDAGLHHTSFFKRLVVIDDNGHNAHKRSRYRILRSLARQATPADFSGRRGVMILRGQSGNGRVLTNEQEVAALAARRGFRVLDPTRCTAAQMLEACLDAPVVMGVEGSHLANGLLWMAEGGAMMVIQPPQRFVTVLKSSCDSIGVRYGFVVAEPAADESFHVAIDAVDRMLDRLGA